MSWTQQLTTRALKSLHHRLLKSSMVIPNQDALKSCKNVFCNKTLRLTPRHYFGRLILLLSPSVTILLYFLMFRKMATFSCVSMKKYFKHWQLNFESFQFCQNWHPWDFQLHDLSTLRNDVLHFYQIILQTNKTHFTFSFFLVQLHR